MLPTIRRGPWLSDEPFVRLRSEIDSLFDRVFGGDGGTLTQAWSHFSVPVAMWEDEDRVYVEAELPGMAEKDVEVTVHNGMLFLRGARRIEEGRTYLYNSRGFGWFERVLALPEAVNTDAIEARLTNGVLYITLPKSAEAKPKRIALTTS